MFNIKKGMLSLNVKCATNKITLSFATDDLSLLTGFSKATLQGEQAGANRYLSLYRPHDCKSGLMWYFQSRGYTVNEPIPHVHKLSLGSPSTAIVP